LGLLPRPPGCVSPKSQAAGAFVFFDGFPSASGPDFHSFPSPLEIRFLCSLPFSHRTPRFFAAIVLCPGFSPFPALFCTSSGFRDSRFLSARFFFRFSIYMYRPIPENSSYISFSLRGGSSYFFHLLFPHFLSRQPSNADSGDSFPTPATLTLVLFPALFPLHGPRQPNTMYNRIFSVFFHPMARSSIYSFSASTTGSATRTVEAFICVSSVSPGQRFQTSFLATLAPWRHGLL